MRVAAIVVIALALGISGLTFYLVQTYLQSQSVSPAEAKVKPVASVQIVVASKDLPAGSILQDDDAKWQPWPDQSLDQSFVVQRDGQGAEQIDEFVGTVVRRGISLGEPVTFSRVFNRDAAGFMAGALTPGMRAISIRINAASSAGGFIAPGDHVDVILTQDIGDDGGQQGGPRMRRASETILRNVRVLAIDQNANDLEGGTVVGQTATLEATSKQAEKLAVAGAMGVLSLSLRSLSPGAHAPTAQSFTSDLDVSVALGGGKPGSGKESKSADNARTFTTVKVYRAVDAATVRVNQ